MRTFWQHKDLPEGTRDVLDIEQVELKGFSRSIAEIEWLLLLLVVLYYVSPGAEVIDPFGLVMSTVLFAVFVLTFHYVNYNTVHSRWKLAIETWVMIAYITWVVWNTGNTESPLLNLYLLVIISSAITLGRVTTLLEIALIGAFYFYLASRDTPVLSFSFIEFSELMVYFAPFLLIAYITSMLAADVNYGKKMLKALSQVDDMTSLLNKRSFMPLFNKAAEVAARYSEPLSVMMIDADHLKKVNDGHGHKAGDKLITTIALSIQDSLRATDVICRFGGDEFVAILPKLSAAKARETAERLRSSIENTSFDVDGVRVSTTASIGIATYPDEVEDVNQLMEKADEALYVSKTVGRNAVTAYSMIMQAEMTGVEQGNESEPGQSGSMT
ncbi:MAG: diguanylate cyclase [Pseudohongiellaceae bacterium]